MPPFRRPPRPHPRSRTLPPETNLDPVRIARAVAVFEEEIANGAVPGGVVCAARNGVVFLHQAFGTLDGDAPVTLDTRYDLASLTKPMSTGATLLRLVEDGVLSLQSRAAEPLGVGKDDFPNVTIGQLLTHTSGLPPWSPLYENGLGREAAVQAILALSRADAGTKYAYSCLGFILLQRILENVTGRTLDQLVTELVFEPLGIADTCYQPAVYPGVNIAPTKSGEGPDKDSLLTGIVHDGNARGIGGVSGNAGLFGTAADVLRFGEAVRTGAFFGAPTRARILTNQVDPTVGFHSLLFFAYGNPFCPSGDLLSPRTVGHSGFTGTVLTLDPEYDLTVAVLTNSVYSDRSSWLTLRRRFLNVLASAIV